jgi:hypothetical protein
MGSGFFKTFTKLWGKTLRQCLGILRIKFKKRGKKQTQSWGLGYEWGSCGYWGIKDWG